MFLNGHDVSCYSFSFTLVLFHFNFFSFYFVLLNGCVVMWCSWRVRLDHDVPQWLFHMEMFIMVAFCKPWFSLVSHGLVWTRPTMVDYGWFSSHCSVQQGLCWKVMLVFIYQIAMSSCVHYIVTLSDIRHIATSSFYSSHCNIRFWFITARCQVFICHNVTTGFVCHTLMFM